MITLYHINLWSRGDKTILVWFQNFIETNIGKVTFVKSTNNPDILISSCFGNINNIKKIKSKVKIFFYGENLNRYLPYNNLDLLKNIFDMIVGFKYTNKTDKLYRLPLWLCYYPYYNMNNSNDNVLTYLNNSYLNNLKINKDGAVLISRHE